jgi:hypothetical protein
VYIESNAGIGGSWTYRRLDGTVIDDRRHLQTILVSQIWIARKTHLAPIAVEHQLQSFSDLGMPSINWFLIRSADDPETAYFMGFECRSRRLVGYLDLNGFTITAPSSKTSFRIPEGFDAFSRCVASAQLGPYSRESAYEIGENLMGGGPSPVNVAPDAVWILTQGKIVEVQLRARTVRTLITDRPDFEALNAVTSLRDGKNVLRLVIPTDAGLVMFDPETASSVDVPIDLSDRESNLQLYPLKSGHQILIQSNRAGPVGGPRSSHIWWFGEAVQIERETDIPDRTIVREGSQIEMAAFAFTVPSPVVVTSGMFLAPLFGPSSWEPNLSYAKRLGVAFKAIRLWLALTLAIGILTGWACRRREIAVFGSSSWFWPILVGLFGWFGWVGYTRVRPLPARLPVPQWMPLKPEPSLPIGTEIFA